MSNPGTLSERLAAGSSAIFFGALIDLRKLSEPDAIVVVVESLRLISESSLLAERKKGERVTAIFQALRVSPALVSAVCTAAGELAPAVRNALAQYVPSELRPRLAQVLSPAAALGLAGASGELSEQAAITLPVPAFRPVGRGGDSNGDDDSYSTVFLLSAIDNQSGNASLLRGRGFIPVHFLDWEKARNDLLSNPNVCGCVIDASFLSSMGEDERRGVVAVLSEYSTFLWLRIQDDPGLRLEPQTIRELIRTTRCQTSDVAAHELSIRPESTMQGHEIADAERSRDSLRAFQGITFIPRELSEPEARLLVAAVRRAENEARYVRIDNPRSMQVEFLSGMSGARTLQAQLDADGPPAIAKISTKSRIADEIRRFHRFIQPWDQELRPRAYFHGDAATLLFGLIPSVEDLTRPAEVLEARLQALWNAEVFASTEEQSETVKVMSSNMAAGLEQVALRLSELNRRSPGVSEYTLSAFPDPHYLSRLESRGFCWGLPDASRDARERAARVYQDLNGAAIVHGDLHLGNILLRSDRDPHVVDYANSGPGHPAIDLVRFELALFAGFMRPVGGSEDYTKLQEFISSDDGTIETLRSEFPRLHNCHLNRAVIAGCVAARTQALSVLRTHGAGRGDYIAAKFLVAWQNLLYDRRQAAHATAVIRAITDEALSL